MSDIQSQLPVRITDGTNTTTITTNSALKVDNSGVTQPVSGSVSVSNFPSTQAVTGTFWQATQPVSGTFWQATQPVSGTVSVSNFPATQPVSGTVSVSNFPATQAVTGTFWQTTQPISGTVSVSGTVATAAGETSSGVVVNYASVTAIGVGGNGSVTYTVTTGKTLYLKQVHAAASGAPCKISVNYGSSPTTIVAVGFTSTANPNFDLTFAQPIAISSGTVVNITIYNNALVSQDVYGTLIGHEV